MSRGVNQVKRIFLTILCIIHLDGMALDGDSTLSFQVHVIKHLGLHILTGYSVSDFE